MKSERLAFRVTEEQKEQIQTLADEDNRSMSDWVRLTVLDKIEEEMKMKKTNDRLNLMYEDEKGFYHNLTETLDLNVIEWQGRYDLEKYLAVQELTFQDIQEALNRDGWGDIEYERLEAAPFPLYAIEEEKDNGALTEITYYRDADTAIEEAQKQFKHLSKDKCYKDIVKAMEYVNENLDGDILWSSK